jgi:hypothetical protein
MDPFFRDLGNLQAKFLILESNIRMFLFHQGRWPFMQAFDTIKVGDLVEANPFTKWSNLPALIDEYNEAVQHDPERVVEGDYIVEVRNALAHGRIYRRSVESQPMLYKFSKKPDKGKLRTEVVETLDPLKLAGWNGNLFMAIRRVEEALHSAGAARVTRTAAPAPAASPAAPSSSGPDTPDT